MCVICAASIWVELHLPSHSSALRRQMRMSSGIKDPLMTVDLIATYLLPALTKIPGAEEMCHGRAFLLCGPLLQGCS